MSSTPSNRPRRRRLAKPPPDLFPDFLRLAFVIAIAIAIAAGCSYFVPVHNRQPNPFCDSDSDDFLFDSCEPCPRNGRCYEGKLACDQGYEKHGKKCVEIVYLDLTLIGILERVENKLCKAYVKAVCDGRGTVWVPQVELMDAVNGDAWDGIKYLHILEYEIVTDRAMKEIYELYDTRLGDRRGFDYFKCPAPLAEKYKPFSCRIKKWIPKDYPIL